MSRCWSRNADASYPCGFLVVTGAQLPTDSWCVAYLAPVLRGGSTHTLSFVFSLYQYGNPLGAGCTVHPSTVASRPGGTLRFRPLALATLMNSTVYRLELRTVSSLSADPPRAHHWDHVIFSTKLLRNGCSTTAVTPANDALDFQSCVYCLVIRLPSHCASQVSDTRLRPRRRPQCFRTCGRPAIPSSKTLPMRMKWQQGVPKV